MECTGKIMSACLSVSQSVSLLKDLVYLRKGLRVGDPPEPWEEFCGGGRQLR